MIDQTKRAGKFRVVCTACDFCTEYDFGSLELAVEEAEAHRAKNPEHPDNAILVVTRKTSGMLCHGHMRSRRGT